MQTPGASSGYSRDLSQITASPLPLPTRAALVGSLDSVFAYATGVCLKAGLVRGSHAFSVALPGGGPRHRVVVSTPVDGVEPYVAVQHARAAAFRIKGTTEAEKLQSLRAHDQVRPPAKGRKTPFFRDSDRLDAMVKKTMGMEDPTVLISEFQLPRAFSFGGGPAPTERPLFAPLLGAIDKWGSLFPSVGYRDRMNQAADLGDYTTHDPDTLHPRFLEYVKERITAVDKRTDEVMLGAVGVQQAAWAAAGVSVRPRQLTDAAPEVLVTMLNSGSPGEYRACGISDRRDPRLVEVMSKSLQRYGRAGRLVAAGKRAPGWVATTAQPNLTFGKEEPKAAKLGGGGERVAPVPRFIFNMSPINYALCAFLHSDISHALQERDPMHGPGFGPGRGRSGKFLDLVERCFKGGVTVPEGEEMVMSDINKWDANMREALLGYAYDSLEGAVDRTGVDGVLAATRGVMSSVCRRQLLEKLVEHPSGYLLRMFGTMPSGSYHTSLTNTNANNLLLIGHLIDRLSSEAGFTVAGAAEAALRAVVGYLVSYGDNQLFSARIFTQFGLRYDPQKHAEFLARFGMTLKVDETEVTRSLGRVRFCSRCVVRTPEGLMITRTHTSMAAKLAARPEHDPLADKLYVRAIMADHMGTDPVVYDMLSQIDRSLTVNIDLADVTPRVRPLLASAARSLVGADDDLSLREVLAGLSTTRIERRSLLSLHTPAGVRTHAQMKVGSGVAPVQFFGGPLTPQAEWALEQDPKSWERYLIATGQTGIIHE